MINLIWIIPVCFFGTIGVMALWWRLLNWLGEHHKETLNRWTERLFPGITGKKQ